MCVVCVYIHRGKGEMKYDEERNIIEERGDVVTRNSYSKRQEKGMHNCVYNILKLNSVKKNTAIVFNHFCPVHPLPL